MDKKLRKLEETFNIAQEKVDNFDIDEETKDIVLADDQYEFDTGPVELTESGQVFELIDLKSDFLSVKLNLQSLVRKGQRLLDQALENPDASSSSRNIEAISRLSEVVGKQCQTLVELYTAIDSIQSKHKEQSSSTTITTNNNSIFVGDTATLLDAIKNRDSN